MVESIIITYIIHIIIIVENIIINIHNTGNCYGREYYNYLHNTYHHYSR